MEIPPTTRSIARPAWILIAVIAASAPSRGSRAQAPAPTDPAGSPSGAPGTEPRPAGSGATKAEPPPSPLVPAYEAKLMGAHAVNLGKVRFQPGKGLSVSTEDEAFSLVLKTRAQLLYTYEREDGDHAQSFQIRRARITMAGAAFGKHNKYKLELAISPGDVALGDAGPRRTPLLDWYFEFDYLRDFTVRAGQYKVPFSRQRVISSGDLQLVDRSSVNAEFNLDRDIGLDVRSVDFLGTKRLRYYAGLYIGEGRDANRSGDMGFMYIGRVEVLPLGPFRDYEEADFERRLAPRLSLGLAYAFVDEAKGNRGILGSRPADGGTSDYHNVTADLMFKAAGFSLQSEFFWRDGSRNPGGAVDDKGLPIAVERPRNGWGVFVQGGFLIPRTPVEIAARYDLIRPLDGATSSLKPTQQVGGGLSVYVGHHSLKVQADYFRAWGADGIGAGRDQVRLQLQAAL